MHSEWFGQVLSEYSFSQKMKSSMLIIFVAVALLGRSNANTGDECDLPTENVVQRILASIVEERFPEGQNTEGLTVTVINMTFTCLARVAFDKYSHVSVVVYSTTSTNRSNVELKQFEIICMSGNIWKHSDTPENFVPQMAFDVETESQCSSCAQYPPTKPNYNAVTNCVYCDTNCREIGQGLCKHSPFNCCPYFNSDTGVCVKDCTTIHPEFGPNNNFQCVCQISCQPGYTKNTTQCSCDFTDGCAAAGQPCQYGGTCTSQLTASPYYSCQCAAGYTGQNCSIQIIHCAPGCRTGQCDIITGCCAICKDEHFLQNNCNCVKATTTEPPTTPTERPERVCPPTCQECEVGNPSCCSVCPQGFQVASCQCVEDAASPAAASSQVAGIAIGLLLFVLLIMSSAALLAYVLYYMWANKMKMKKGRRMGPFSRSDLHSNPLYINPDEVEG